MARFLNLFSVKSDMIVAFSVVFVIMMLIIPLPTVLLDTLMAFNITLSLVVILIVLYTKNAVEFSIFPTLLLLSTVFGLALNVSSTRLILSKGSFFDGRMIRSFSSFVVSGEGAEGLVIGFIIFAILIAVQFIVITKGTTRVAEVAARFTLDSLPGKQMAIEAEYHAGGLTEEMLAKRKMELEREVDFYGAMDGASKFVSGNVKVGILITLVNIIGGIIVGMTIHQESLTIALDTYVSLTIGDGLVSQLPSLLISTAAGLIVTRAISDGSFGEDIGQQFTRESRIYWIAAIFLAVLGILPGFPWYVLFPLAGLSAYTAFRLGKKIRRELQTEEAKTEKKSSDEEPSTVAPLDPISLEIGVGLVPLVEEGSGADLLDRVTNIRRQTALELGLVVPRIRIMDNQSLDISQYSIKIRGSEIGTSTLRVGGYLAINPGTVRQEISGETTKDPTFGFPAMWIQEEQRRTAEVAGYTVVDSTSVIATHLSELIKVHAADILGRQEVRSMLEVLKDPYSAVVEEVQKHFSLGEIQKVLQGLLREQISIRNIVTILETMADYATINKAVAYLIEKVRQALGRQICMKYVDDKKILRAITMDPLLERRIIESRFETVSGSNVGLPPEDYRSIIAAIKASIQTAQEQGMHPVLLSSEEGRPLIKMMTAREIPQLVVLSVAEIVSGIQLESISRVENTIEQEVRT